MGNNFFQSKRFKNHTLSCKVKYASKRESCVPRVEFRAVRDFPRDQAFSFSLYIVVSEVFLFSETKLSREDWNLWEQKEERKTSGTRVFELQKKKQKKTKISIKAS